MATSTSVASSLAFNTAGATSSVADISASTNDTVTAYILPVANPSKLGYEVILDVGPDGTNWFPAASFKMLGDRTTMAQFSVNGIKASKARLRQSDVNQGSNALKISAWISA